MCHLTASTIEISFDFSTMKASLKGFFLFVEDELDFIASLKEYDLDEEDTLVPPVRRNTRITVAFLLIS